MIAGCDRATHTVEQMLTLARLAPDAVSFQPAPVELGAVLKDTIGDLAQAALAKGMDIELTLEQDVSAFGDAGLLAILFRNLIDNALRYSPPATRVAIQIESGDDEALVEALVVAAQAGAQRGELGAAAKSRFAERYSLERMVDAYAALLVEAAR